MDMSKPPGLQNIGNTCYFNAVIQSLYRTNVFVDNLQGVNSSNESDDDDDDDESNISFHRLRSFFAWSSSKSPHQEFKNHFICIFRVVWFATSCIAGSAEFHKSLFSPNVSRNLTKILGPNTSTIIVSFNDFENHSSPLTYRQTLDSVHTCPVQVPITTTPCVPITPTPYVVITPTPYLGLVLLSTVALCATFKCYCRRYSVGKTVYQFLQWIKLKFSYEMKKDFAPFCVLSGLSYIAGYLVTPFRRSYIISPYEVPALIGVCCELFYHQSRIVCSLRKLLSRVSEPRPQGSVTVTLARLFQNMRSGGRARPINPGSVLQAVCARASRFCGFRQEDSHDLLRHLLDGVRDDEKQQKKLLTVVDKVFGGHFRTTYNCFSCRTPHFLYEPFLDISLPILLHDDTWEEIADDQNKVYQQWSAGYPIEFLLKVFTRTENLGKEYLCTACNAHMTGDNFVLTEGTKQTLICDPPAILCIHLKRFKQLEGGRGFEKANDHVQFSEFLDLKPFLSAECQRINKGQEKVWYSLYAVVVHSGSLEGGHYTAYIKSKKNASRNEQFLQEDGFDWNQLPSDAFSSLERASPVLLNETLELSPTPGHWYYTSDSAVRVANVAEVLKQQAYLLFYERLS